MNTLRHVTLVPSKDTKIANVKFDKKTWKMGFSRMAWDTGCPPSK